MENKIWYRNEKDITSLSEEKNFEAIQSYVTLNKRLLIHLWETDQIDELRKSLRFGSGEMNYLENWLKDLSKENAYYLFFLLGNLSGTVELMDRMLNQYDHIKQTLNEVHAKAAVTKHLPEVVKALETHGMMTHSELCSELDMNASTLTEAMKKILQTGMLKTSVCGKYKLYNLTEAGHQYGKTIRNLRQEEHSSEELLTALSRIIANLEDPTELRRKIGQLFADQNTHTISVGDKFALTYKEKRLTKKDYYRINMILEKENELQGSTISLGCSKIDAQASIRQNDYFDCLGEQTSA